MNEEQKLRAIEIISKSNNCKVGFNIWAGDNANSQFELVIFESNASVLRELHNAGFHLAMSPQGLVVTYY